MALDLEQTLEAMTRIAEQLPALGDPERRWLQQRLDAEMGKEPTPVRRTRRSSRLERGDDPPPDDGGEKASAPAEPREEPAPEPRKPARKPPADPVALLARARAGVPVDDEPRRGILLHDERDGSTTVIGARR